MKTIERVIKLKMFKMVCAITLLDLFIFKVLALIIHGYEISLIHLNKFFLRILNDFVLPCKPLLLLDKK